MGTIFCFSGGPRVLLAHLCLCCTSPLGVSSRQSAQALCLSSTPALQQAPTCCWQTWALELLLNWEVLFHTISVVNFLPFAFGAPVSLHWTPLWGSKASPSSHLWGGFLVYRNLPSFRSPFPEAQVPVWKSYLLFSLLPYLSAMRLVCFSGSLGTSASVKKMFGSCSICRWFLKYICRGKAVLSVLFLCHLEGPSNYF